MHGPPDTSMGRGMLLGAALMLVLALWMSFGRGEWAEAVVWYAIAIFFASYGGLLGGADERWHRPLLLAGLLSGIVAFLAALRSVGVVLW
jgi:hypothetical protein